MDYGRSNGHHRPASDALARSADMGIMRVSIGIAQKAARAAHRNQTGPSPGCPGSDVEDQTLPPAPGPAAFAVFGRGSVTARAAWRHGAPFPGSLPLLCLVYRPG